VDIAGVVTGGDRVEAIGALAFGIPALIAGEAVTRYGLRDTATVYAIVVIALALAAALSTGRTPSASRRAVDITTAETTKSEI